jgi:hypothetical protein
MTSTDRLPRLFVAIVGACLGATLAVHAQQGRRDAPVTPATGRSGGAAAPVARTPEQRAERTRRAEQRALFAAEEPLPVTLIADFKAINRDRDPNSTKTFPGTVVVKNGDREDRIAVQLRTRGHARRNVATCAFAPLRIEFPKEASGTVFEGHKAIKLGTHCRDVDSFEQYVYREYAAYRIFNLITPRSFRARLAAMTYVDAATSRPIASRGGLFLEDDDDVARRLDGETTELQGLPFSAVDGETMTALSLFEYMIGNTDVSLYRLHNIRLVRDPAGHTYPVPYDFDYSGLVNARYAIPDKQFNLASVRERLYLGPCRTPEELEPVLARFRSVREPVLALYDRVPNLDAGYRKDARGYLEQFFRLIDRPENVKRTFVDACRRRTTM